ncbi:hypothetical protein [Aquimarina mytili]|uniref:Uncharacterized protein n=1 Tax=Aquimarina mytili TaxID=874423 RepID=A0A936ZR94_9FLAO|nr:hypothetical protein [Aquimarina mytili]MBL0683253.1 hypothetical protein [Aquimarina mytili]
MNPNFLKILLSTIFLCYSNLSISQGAIKDSVLLDIPNIGKLGGAHMLNWALDKEENKIYLYAYSHVRGSQFISSVEEMEAAKREHDSKGFFGKMFSSMAKDNMYNDTTIPVVMEGVVSTQDLTATETKRNLFHKIEELPEGKKVFFRPKENVIDITGFETGTGLEYHYNDLNTAYKYAPQLDKELLSLTEMKFKGEGLLGLKNIKPWMISRKAFFRYVPFKGYMSETEKKDLINLKDNPELDGYEVVRDSDNAIGKNHIVWFVKEKDDSDYKMLSFNEETQETKIQSFTFDTPRKPKVTSKVVYNKNLEPTGFVTVFGYHKKGKKSETYTKTDFDMLYTDASGNIKVQTKFSHGTEKKYKRVVSPILLIDQGDNTLKIVNNHQLSLLSSTFEIFTLNKDGVLNVETSEDFFKVEGETKRNYYNYLVDFNSIDKMGEYYVIRKDNIENTTVPSSDPNSSLPQKVTNYKGYNFTLLDGTFKPIKFGALHSSFNERESFSFQDIELTNNRYVMLAERAGRYFLTTITPDEGVATISLETEYGKKSSSKLYFGSYMHDFALVNEDKKELYILHQYYTKAQTGEKILDKAAIVKVAY